MLFQPSFFLLILLFRFYYYLLYQFLYLLMMRTQLSFRLHHQSIVHKFPYYFGKLPNVDGLKYRKSSCGFACANAVFFLVLLMPCRFIFFSTIRLECNYTNFVIVTCYADFPAFLLNSSPTNLIPFPL